MVQFVNDRGILRARPIIRGEPGKLHMIPKPPKVKAKVEKPKSSEPIEPVEPEELIFPEPKSKPVVKATVVSKEVRPDLVIEDSSEEPQESLEEALEEEGKSETKEEEKPAEEPEIVPEKFKKSSKKRKSWK